MNNSDKLKYYRTRGVKLMNSIEDKTGKMFHEFNAQIERKFWEANDSQNIKELMKIHSILCELHDNLTND